MTGVELQQQLLQKWGRSYDLQLRRTQGKLFFQVMWRYLEQASFPMEPAAYGEHLDQVANYLMALGAEEQVEDFLRQTKDRPRVGRAVSLQLVVALGDRASEWMLD
jgi:hypothetical protein